MRVYHTEIEVIKDDLDNLAHVNNVRYVQWVQDVAQEHWERCAPKDVKDKVVWVLLKHTIQYKSAAVLADIITAKTYIKTNKGATSTRIVEMYNKASGQLLVHSETEWCLLNGKTLRPIRVTEEMKSFFMNEESVT